MMIAELQGASATWLHACGILLLVARLIHPFGIKQDNPAQVLRGLGSAGTTLAMLIAIVIILGNAFS